jgi:branched-chain amino acid transport system permease protein
LVISSQWYLVWAFALAAASGGAAGWLYVYTIGFVSPVEMELLLSINLLAVMIVGGMGSVLGSLLGGVLYVYVPVVAGTVDPVRTTLLYGAILVLVLFTAPGGIARALHRTGDWLGGLRAGRGPDPPGPGAVAMADPAASPSPRPS